MDKKKIKSFLLVFILFLYVDLAWGELGAAGAANNQGVMSMVGSQAAMSYASSQFSRCNSRRWAPCIRGMIAIGVSQTLRSNGNQAFDVRGLYESSADNWGQDPSELGFCYGSGENCDNGVLDGLSAAVKTGDVKDYNSALDKTENKLKKVLSDLKKKGLNVDVNSKTLGVNGKSISLSDSNLEAKGLSGLLNKADKLRMEKVRQGLNKNLGSKKRAVASQGGAGGSFSNKRKVIKLSDYDSSNGNGYKDLDKKKEKFLAGLSGKKVPGGVGVAGDSLFKMVQRRYNIKTKAQEFINK